MAEFLPFDPFQSIIPEQADSIEETPVLQTVSSCTHTIEPPSSETTPYSSTTALSESKKNSEHHNKVKQLVITMKQMMAASIYEIGSSDSHRKIIQQSWQALVRAKCPSKSTLQVMFNLELDVKLARRTGLLNIIEEYGINTFNNAMEELKDQILWTMRGECLKSHLLDRKLNQREHLMAYIQYFLYHEMKPGKVSNRFGSDAAAKIQALMAKNADEDALIECYFADSTEVFERFASLNNVTF